MADDNNQRPYRTTETRANPSAASSSGNDPLAELARLIGQTDPFAEFGRDTARRAAPAPETQSNWPSQPASPSYAAPQPAPEPRAPTANLFGATSHQETPPSQPYGAPPRYSAPPFAASGGLYRTGSETNTYAAPVAPTDDYGGDQYFQGARQGVEDEDIYDDAPPPRRRMGIVAIAGVFALAVVGTAGAIGYRAIFGSSGSHAPPPVIKADTTPSKVMPSTSGKDAQSNKLITDRVGGGGQSEKVVSREEQPVDVKDTMAVAQMSQNQGQAAQPSAPLAPAMGSGVVTSEPKKIHTITIRPDQVGLADTGGSAPTQVAQPEPLAPAPKPAAPPRANVPPVADNQPPAVPEPRQAPPAPAVHRTAATSNAPLSLSPGASAPSRPAPAPQTTRVAPQPASGGGYAVQVSAQRSEAEAEAAFRNMQAKFPNQLGGKKPMIHRVDLGSKGIYFRAMVGPFANSAEAGELCSSLKSAGGQCIVQKI